MMTQLQSLDKEVKLRTLFVELAGKKGYDDAIVHLDLFNFFDLKTTLSLSGIHDLWKSRVLKVEGSENRVGLHIHIPFCQKICSYCNLNTQVYTGEAQLHAYTQCLLQEVRCLRDIFKNIKLKIFHFGGGSPNLLGGPDLKSILEELAQSFSFEESAEKTFECNPNHFSVEQLAVLGAFGINRISFGVQSLDSGVLQSTNRGHQNYENIQSAIENARKLAALESINVDLMIGLWNDTPQTVLDSFIKLAELKVDSICLYPLIPTPQYLKKYYDSLKNLFDQEMADKISRFEKLVMPEAERHGYGFVPLSHSGPDRATWNFILQKHLASDQRKYQFRTDDYPFDYLGIGAGSWSMIRETAYYRNEGYKDLSVDGGAIDARYSAVFLRDQWERIFYIRERFLERNRLSLSQYRDQFGTDIRDDFKHPIEQLKRLGALTLDEDVLFFTAGSQEEKFTHLLFFVDPSIILSELDRLVAKG